MEEIITNHWRTIADAAVILAIAWYALMIARIEDYTSSKNKKGN